MQEEIIERLGKYEIIEVAGKGAQGVVLRGHDPFVDRDVAIKLCRLGAVPEDTRKMLRKFFFNEAQAAGHLDHPNILRVYDAGESDGEPFIVMEYVAGADTLGNYIRSDGLLPPAEAVAYVRQCAEALDYAHRRGVIHRDVKPANIMLTREQQVKLVDFGIAYRTETDKTQLEGNFGSPRYMSPEQARGEDVGAQSDLFSLGIVLYELLAGNVPFQAKNVAGMVYQIVNGEPEPVRNHVPHLPDVVVEILNRALSKPLDQRFKTGQEMADVLAVAQATLEKPEAALDDEQKLAMMRRLAFFSNFSEPELEEVLAEAEWESYRAQSTVMHDGAEGGSLYIIVEGQVRVVKQGVSVVELEAGDCFGELGYLEGLALVGSVIPTVRSTFLRIEEPTKEWASLPCQLRFSARLQRTVAERLADMTRRVVEVAN